MTKWADYIITAAKLNNQKNLIQEVLVRQGAEIKLSSAENFSRDQIIRNMVEGKTFTTGYVGCGTCRRGSDVNLISIDEEQFIRIDLEEIKCDKLGAIRNII